MKNKVLISLNALVLVVGVFPVTVQAKVPIRIVDRGQFCAPRPDGQRCAESNCPVQGEKCQPRFVQCTPDGTCKVTECDCLNSSRCHVAIARTIGGASHPVCRGRCPIGFDCSLQREPQDDGSSLFWCDCAPVPCEPAEGGLSCRKHNCEGFDEKCLPNRIVCDAEGRCDVAECDCRNRVTCRPRMPERGLVTPDFQFCRGFCPDGTRCEEFRALLPEGGFEVSCHCLPEGCEPTDDGRRCQDTVCRNDGERCVPRGVLCDVDGHCRVDRCECQDAGICHPRINDDPTLPPVECVGECPPGHTCELFRQMTASGETLLTCRCVPQPDCGPTDDGLHCRDVPCPGSDQRCTPTRIICRPNGPCHVLSCDCQTGDRCHPEINNNPAGPPVVCVGDCPPGHICEPFREMEPNGGFVVSCRCIPEPVCEPNDSGFGCNDVVCPDRMQRCIPTEVVCHPGAPCRVVNCDCRDPEVCHVELGSAAIPICLGACPPGTECERFARMTPDGGTAYRCECLPMEACGPDPANPTRCRPGCNTPNEICRPNRVVCIGGVCRVVDCECDFTEGCHVALPTPTAPQCVGTCRAGETCVEEVTTVTPSTCALPVDPGPCDGAFPRWAFDSAAGHCSLFTYGGCAGNGNNFRTREECEAVCPEGGVVFACHCEPLPVCVPDASGQHCINTVCPDSTEQCRPSKVLCSPNEGCRIVECDCTSTGVCHVEFTAGSVPSCVGGCPTGAECIRQETQTDRGLLIECLCRPVQQDCEPDPSSPTLCSLIFCPIPNDRCLPTRAICTPNGCVPEGCECLPFFGCRVHITPAGAICDGTCPPGTECERQETQLSDGSVAVECHCVPVPMCGPDDTGLHCRDVLCPSNNEKCLPRRIACGENGDCHVVDCDCQGADRCHPEITDGTEAPPVVCVGSCPMGTQCVRTVTTDPATGLFIVECHCQPIQQDCEPEASSATGCRMITCPTPNERCVPQTVVCTPNGCSVVNCECQDPGRCHITAPTIGAPPMCVGECPLGQTCMLQDLAVGPAERILRCECVDAPPECSPDPSGLRCSQTMCSSNTQACTPTRVLCNTAGTDCRVIDCDCLQSPACHPVLGTDPTQPPVTCQGGCRMGTTCEVHRTFVDNGVIIECVCPQ
ncbi:MAG: BPTI/Kunitz domain-containing protein [Planctomycetota bacterium]